MASLQATFDIDEFGFIDATPVFALDIDYSGGCAAYADAFLDIATELVPVDTGALQDSISASASNSSVEFEAGMDYASYVEYGTYKMEAQPYFNDALEEGLAEGIGEWIDEIINVFDQEAGEIGDNIEVLENHMSMLDDEMDALESKLQELEAELMALYDALDDCEDEEEAELIMAEIEEVRGEMMAVEEELMERMNEYLMLWLEWGQWLDELMLSEEFRIMAFEAVASAIPPTDEGE